MLALAEAFRKAKDTNKMDEWEAKSLGVSIERLRLGREGYKATYEVVTDTFEKGYRLPSYKRSFTWADCKFY